MGKTIQHTLESEVHSHTGSPAHLGALSVFLWLLIPPYSGLLVPSCPLQERILQMYSN